MKISNKISNKIIHSKLIIGEKITSLYSFGGMCILRRVLERNAQPKEDTTLEGNVDNWGCLGAGRVCSYL